MLAGPQEIGVITQIVGTCLQSGLGEEFFRDVCKRISYMEAESVSLASTRKIRTAKKSIGNCCGRTLQAQKTRDLCKEVSLIFPTARKGARDFRSKRAKFKSLCARKALDTGNFCAEFARHLQKQCMESSRLSED